VNLGRLLAGLLAIPTFAALLPLTACDSASEGGCCPIDPPSCNGTRLGGSPDANGRCGGAIADAPPPTFSSYVDENGCPAFRVSGYDAGQDAQPDADASRDASSDAQRDAPASDASSD
jgi:hypothetical protein